MIIKIKHEKVSKLIIFNNNRVLLLKRSNKFVTDESPWTWDLPGGHIEEGETSQDAVKRETKEETQLRITSLFYVGSDSNVGKLTYFYGTVRLNEGVAPEINLSDEHEEYKWVGRQEMIDYRDNIGVMYYQMVSKSYDMLQ
tara:strand:- start:59 stop:481 length:423 start_codon:yes stop_codon:yes gene_type:complete